MRARGDRNADLNSSGLQRLCPRHAAKAFEFKDSVSKFYELSLLFMALVAVAAFELPVEPRAKLEPVEMDAAI